MSKQILLVAYDSDVLKSFPVTLSNAGHTVTLAHGGLDGIKMAAATSPDLVVVDVTLPDMDGSTVQHILHRLPITKQVPTLLLKPRAHPLMPPGIMVEGARMGRWESLNPNELLRQVGDALLAS